MRASWDDVWMSVAIELTQRSRCVRRYAAVIVDAENRIVATGINGPPAPWRKAVTESCEAWCPHAQVPAGSEVGYSRCIAIHAEANSLLFCDRRDRVNGTIYVTGIPCIDCTKLIANSGLARVVFKHDGAEYRGLDEVLEILTDSEIEPRVV